ncbi:carbonate dehydratase [Tepidimonas taiwanensis]|uniref:Carbonic anhydrase n=1 Tax=Tepidimonas taiwanensis TaxID=307486 RepID=A0A554XCP0_9BURK|nr:carbonate dehydratase [Tepidimonas taiwanensis]TSE33598.1 Carbonic anhydrase 2 [Tepidimonas taiwanensis]UBQ05706.1 carbonate dehydratase [Tepidimonas taiwanensis]
MPWRHLLAHNREWAARMEAERPGFFARLAQQQSPRYMWIGCSDSRVPANQITGLEPGEVFVHRNVANVVVPTDLNCLSTIQYAVDMLRVEHLMVVGHYGCGGVQAALEGIRVGLADNWLRHVRDVADRHQRWLLAVPAERRLDLLCELNVIEQVRHVAQSTVLQDAWARGQPVMLHGWVYGLKDGLLQDLRLSMDSPDRVEAVYRAACEVAACRHGADLS